MLWWLQDVASYPTQNATDHERDRYINWHKPPEKHVCVFIRALEQLQTSSTIKVQTFSDYVQYFLPQSSEKYDDGYYSSPRNDVRECDRLREAGEHQRWGEYSKNNLSAI